MKTKFLLPLLSALLITIISGGCKNASSANEPKVNSDSGNVAVTDNPQVSIAPPEYSELAEKSLELIAQKNFDAWGDMLADDVIYEYPDGDMQTRTKISGKQAVIDWWKAGVKNGVQDTMILSEFNHVPIDVSGKLNAGAQAGIYDIVYFTNKLGIKGKTLSIRMNYSIHFNNDKKIDRYYSYYDRTKIIQLSGQNVLDSAMNKK